MMTLYWVQDSGFYDFLTRDVLTGPVSKLTLTQSQRRFDANPTLNDVTSKPLVSKQLDQLRADNCNGFSEIRKNQLTN